MRKVLGLLACVMVVACGPSSPKNGEVRSTPEAAAPSSAEQQARIAALPAPYNEASYDAGRRVFAQCRSCHSIDEGAGNRVGPNLHGVFGREIGALEDFNYSAPVREANFVWDAERLDHWLQNPQTFLPGNRMAFAGVRDATQRRDLIAYLMIEAAD